MTTLGERIKSLREEKGLTQEELAAKAGVSQGTISAYEVERIRDYRLDIVFKIAAALEVAPDYLVHGNGPRSIDSIVGNLRELVVAAQDLNDDQLAVLMSVAKSLKK